MPELPEIQAVVEGLDRAVSGRTVVAARAVHPALVKSAAPGLAEITGGLTSSVWRRGKLSGLSAGSSVLGIPLRQAGRLSRAPSPQPRLPRAVALTLDLDDGRQFRVREAATEHRASAYVVPSDERESLPLIARLGPEPVGLRPEVWRERLSTPPGLLHTAIRQGRRVAGIGRAYASDIMWAARLAPFARTSTMTDEEYARLATAADTVLTQALERARRDIDTDLPNREGRVTLVHGQAGSPCVRCGRTLERVSFEGYELVYCPTCQTDGTVYADRRMSRLLR